MTQIILSQREFPKFPALTKHRSLHTWNTLDQLGFYVRCVDFLQTVSRQPHILRRLGLEPQSHPDTTQPINQTDNFSNLLGNPEALENTTAPNREAFLKLRNKTSIQELLLPPEPVLKYKTSIEDYFEPVMPSGFSLDTDEDYPAEIFQTDTQLCEVHLREIFGSRGTDCSLILSAISLVCRYLLAQNCSTLDPRMGLRLFGTAVIVASKVAHDVLDCRLANRVAEVLECDSWELRIMERAFLQGIEYQAIVSGDSVTKLMGLM